MINFTAKLENEKKDTNKNKENRKTMIEKFIANEAKWIDA